MILSINIGQIEYFQKIIVEVCQSYGEIICKIQHKRVACVILDCRADVIREVFLGQDLLRNFNPTAFYKDLVVGVEIALPNRQIVHSYRRIWIIVGN